MAGRSIDEPPVYGVTLCDGIMPEPVLVGIPPPMPPPMEDGMPEAIEPVGMAPPMVEVMFIMLDGLADLGSMTGSYAAQVGIAATGQSDWTSS